MKMNKHHITPRHLLKHMPKKFVNSPENIVYVTPYQHTALHKWLLMLTGTRGCEMCYHAMLTGKFCSSGVDHPSFGKPSPLRGTRRPKELRDRLSAMKLGELNPFFGKKHTDKTKKRIALLGTGRKRSPETTLLFLGENNPMYGVHRFGERNPFFGKKHTQETKDKISTAKMGQPSTGMLGKTHTPEARELMRAARIGTTLAEETKRKIGAKSKGRVQSKEQREKVSLSKVGRKLLINPTTGVRKYVRAQLISEFLSNGWVLVKP